MMDSLTNRFSGETNGKLEKLFDTIEGGLEKGFFLIKECIFWYD
jgi:hypothetical protein